MLLKEVEELNKKRREEVGEKEKDKGKADKGGRMMVMRKENKVVGRKYEGWSAGKGVRIMVFLVVEKRGIKVKCERRKRRTNIS